MYMINMHPQQVVKLGKYHHERSTEKVRWGGEDEKESKDVMMMTMIFMISLGER